MTAVLLVSIMLTITLVVRRYSNPRHRRRNLYLLGILSLVLMGAMACAVNPTQIIEGLIPVLAGIIPIVASAGEAVLPIEAGLIAAGADLAEMGLKALLTKLKGYQSQPSDQALAEVTAAFNSAHANLMQLQAAAQTKDPVTAMKIGGVVIGVQASLAMVESELTAKHPATVAAAKAQGD